MSKRKIDYSAVEIDAVYEAQVSRLGAVEGHVSDYAIEPRHPGRAQQRQTLVLPERTQQPPVVARRMVQPIDINMPQQAIMAVDVHTSAVDRAKGFSIETHQLGLVVGVLAVLVVVVGFGSPFLTLSTLWTFGVWYTVVWLVAWLFHRIVSPEGLAFFNALMMWRYVNRRG